MRLLIRPAQPYRDPKPNPNPIDNLSVLSRPISETRPAASQMGDATVIDCQLQTPLNLYGSNQLRATAGKLPWVQNTCDCAAYQHQARVLDLVIAGRSSAGHCNQRAADRGLQIKGPQINGSAADNLRHPRPPDIGS